MSMDFLNPIRSYDEVLNKAVRFVLERNYAIMTARPLPIFPYNEFYTICARRYNEMLFGISTNYGNIEFKEFSQNTGYALDSVFHTFQCEQYQRNSIEDEQQIQNLANLMIQFCRERMQKPQP